MTEEDFIQLAWFVNGGDNGILNPTELDDFVDYWTEKNIGGRKMRFQMEKTFDVVRRLKRWKRNSWNKKINLDNL